MAFSASSQNCDILNGLCVFCNENFNVETIAALSCGHCFHHECLKEWILSFSSCPICLDNIHVAVVKVYPPAVSFNVSVGADLKETTALPTDFSDLEQFFSDYKRQATIDEHTFDEYKLWSPRKLQLLAEKHLISAKMYIATSEYCQAGLTAAYGCALLHLAKNSDAFTIFMRTHANEYNECNNILYAIIQFSAYIKQCADRFDSVISPEVIENIEGCFTDSDGPIASVFFHSY